MSTFFSARPPHVWLLLGSLLVGAVGLIDFLTGNEISLSLFYLVPIAAATWYARRDIGLALALASAVVWFIADASSHSYSHPSIGYWNASIRLGFFLIVVQLLGALRSSHREMHRLTFSDSLTEAANSRAFLSRLEDEIARSRRYGHPFSLAYIDLDNFKSVNDSAGHAAGDDVLRLVVDTMQGSLRHNDVVARLGGDEFGLLLPETGPEAAHAAIEKVRSGLLEAMAASKLPVTFSIGVVTQIAEGEGAEELLKRADDLMYEVKRADKNAVRYLVVG